MKLEQQVASLELSKKLKDLGVRQESAFYWVNSDFDAGGYCLHGAEVYEKYPELKSQIECAAFTVAELYKICWDMGFECRIDEPVEPENLANYFAERLCQQLSQ